MTQPGSGNISDDIASALADAGVRYLFGVPGGGNNLDVIGACEARGITFVLAHTETAAAIMATAHAELTGTVGACVVTRGPGAASTVNGAAQAQQDRQPLLVICDSVDDASAPRIAHQNVDQRALFAPVTKWSTTVGRADAAERVRTAVQVALTPPRGAVHLDVDPTSVRPETPMPSSAAPSRPDVATLFAAAQRPVVCVGVGAREHAAAVRALVAETNIPVLATYKARGVVPESGRNSAGVLTGARADAAVLDRADLVVAIGLDTIELIPNPWPYQAPVVTLAEYDDPYRYFEPVATLVGPLSELIGELPELQDGWADDFATTNRFRIEQALFAAPAATDGLAAWEVAGAVRAAAPASSVATVDAGAHMLVVMPLWTVDEPGQVLISSGLATMGYALPAAIGAALARPDERVYCHVGDGGLSMCLAELETLARLDLPVTVIVFNDSTLSLIKVKQRAEGHGGSGAVVYARTDFAAVARGMGVPATSVDDLDALSGALAARTSGPLLIDARVDPGCYPHVLDVVRNRIP